MACGDGSLAHRNFIRSPASPMASSVLVKTRTARSSSAGTAEFTVSLTAKRRLIQFRAEWDRFAAEGCYVAATAVCGSELTTRESYIYGGERQTYLDCHWASQAKPLAYFLRIGKAVCWSQAVTASIAFASSPSQRLL